MEPEQTKVCRRRFVTCRVSREEKEKIEENAAKSGKDTSTFIRERLLDKEEESLAKA